MSDYAFTVVLEKEEDGGFVAACPILQGCYSQGETAEEAVENLKDAVRLHIQARRDLGEEVPTEAGSIRLTVSV